jgi:hypothetical protein
MIDLDDTLSQLANAPVHSGLASIDDAVLTRLALCTAQIPGSAIGLAAVAALLVGVAGAGLPSTRAHAASAGPFGQPSALAPSTLLASNE